MVVGRGPACDIRVDAPQVSRAHAALRRRGTAVYLTDLGSSGGTFVGATPVTGSRELRPGDVVSFAGVTARFEAAATAAEQTMAGGSGSAGAWAPAVAPVAALAPLAGLAPVAPVAPVGSAAARWLSCTGLLVLAEGFGIVAVTRANLDGGGTGLLGRLGPSLGGLPAGVLGWALAAVGFLLAVTGFCLHIAAARSR
jgi:hypothetical protein